MMMCNNCGSSTCMGCGKKCWPAKAAKILLVIGGLNWGLVGLGAFLKINLNVVNMILGSWPTLEWIVYILVGISAIITIFGCRCKMCGPSEGGMKM